MAESTTPEAGVEHSDASILKRLGAVLDDGDQAPPEQNGAPEQVEEQAAPAPEATDELTPDDIPAEEAPAPATAEAFEIVHNGTQHKLSREETIRLAQQGFDYTQKTQALSEKAKGIEAALQRAAEVEQLAPYIVQDQGQLASIQAQLAPYKDVNWVQLATDNPLDYPKYRAQYDALVNTHNQIVGRIDQTVKAYNGHKAQLTAQQQQQELARLPEFVPEWKDPARYQADSKKTFEWLQSKGVDVERASAKLDDAFSCAVVFMAMKYDMLLKSKGEKAKLLQTAPPVARPGVLNTPSSAQADREQQAQRRLRKTGTVEDAAALYMQRLR